MTILSRLTLLTVLALLSLGALAACGSTAAVPEGTEPQTITASVLVEASADEPQWLRDVEVEAGADGYELLEAAVDGELVADWYAEYQSHFVQEILGTAPEGDLFWGFFLWNDQTGGWEPVPTGADGFSVEDGHIVGWAIVAYDPDGGNLPQALP